MLGLTTPLAKSIPLNEGVDHSKRVVDAYFGSLWYILLGVPLLGGTALLMTYHIDYSIGGECKATEAALSLMKNAGWGYFIAIAALVTGLHKPFAAASRRPKWLGLPSGGTQDDEEETNDSDL